MTVPEKNDLSAQYTSGTHRAVKVIKRERWPRKGRRDTAKNSSEIMCMKRRD